MIIGLSGYARAGKDTVGRVLVEEYGFERVAVSDLLMDMALDINSMLPWERPMPGHFDDCVSLGELVNEFGREGAKEFKKVRELLQHLGDGVKKAFGNNIIVDTTMAKLDPLKNYVFTSVRFPEEADAILNTGRGQIWRIERRGVGPANQHRSEVAMDKWLPHHNHWVFSNNGTIQDLEQRVRNHLA